MTDKTYAPHPDVAAAAHADKATYDEMYTRSVNDPDGFWGEEGKRLDWMTPYTRVKNTSFAPGNIDIKWYEDGTLNVAANCIDRHLVDRADHTAIIWEPDDPKAGAQHISYAQLHAHVSKFEIGRAHV